MLLKQHWRFFCALPGLGYGYNYVFYRGKKFFEVSNHLGNVLATVSDRKVGVDDGVYSVGGTQTSTTPDGKIDYYVADVVSEQDYYPFGMLEPGRQYNAGTQYRYGFNGIEKSDEIEGNGVDYDYGARIYDARTGRFLSVDPLQTKFPYYTPCQFSGNTPIQAIDLDGLEPYFVNCRDFSIKWYYQTFNPSSISERNFSWAEFSVRHSDQKYGVDAALRLFSFASDNYYEYWKARNKGDKNPVYRSSEKEGYYDCITAVEAEMQILKNDYTIRAYHNDKRPEDNGNIKKTISKWQNQGILGEQSVFEVKGFNKHKGDNVSQSDFKISGVAEKIITEVDLSKNGVSFFVMAVGGDDHAAMAAISVVNGKATFAMIDQIKGFEIKGNANQFNEYLAKFLFMNSSSAKKDSRIYDPGNGNIPEGELKVTISQVKK